MVLVTRSISRGDAREVSIKQYLAARKSDGDMGLTNILRARWEEVRVGRGGTRNLTKDSLSVPMSETDFEGYN